MPRSSVGSRIPQAEPIFLPYGSGDSNIIFQHDLCSALELGDLNSNWSQLTLLSSRQPVFDSVLGTIGKDDSDNDAGYRFQSGASAINGAATAFQLSIDIQKEWVTIEDSGNGSEGYDPASSEVLVSMLDSGSNYAGVGFRKDTDMLVSSLIAAETINNDFINFKGDLSAAGNPRFSSYGKDGDYITLNLGWSGSLVDGTGLVIMGVNGYPIAYGRPTRASFADPLNNMYFFCDRLSDEFVKNHYARNLQMAIKAPELASGKRHDSIWFLSDSLTDASEQYSHDTAYDNNVKYALQRKTLELSNTFYHNFDSNRISENAGYTVGTSGTQLQTQISTVLSNNPDTLVICGGTNDMLDGGSGYDAADFEAEYKELIEIATGQNGNDVTSVRRLVLCTPPPNFSAVGDTDIEAAHLSVRTIINTLPDWFESNYGSSGIVVVILDNWANMGADHALAENATYPENTSDNTHLSNNWMRLYGERLASLLLSNPIKRFSV